MVVASLGTAYFFGVICVGANESPFEDKSTLPMVGSIVIISFSVFCAARYYLRRRPCGAINVPVAGFIGSYLGIVAAWTVGIGLQRIATGEALQLFQGFLTMLPWTLFFLFMGLWPILLTAWVGAVIVFPLRMCWKPIVASKEEELRSHLPVAEELEEKRMEPLSRDV